MSRASGYAASSARIAASESAQREHHRLAVALGAASRRAAPASVAIGARERGADGAHADHRLDLGRRAVGHDAARAPSARRGRRRRPPPRGSAWRTGPSCRARRTRASSPRTRGGPRRPSRRSARPARAARGSPTSASAKRTRCVSPPDSLCVRRSAMSSMPASSSTSSTASGSRVERGHHRRQLAHRQVADQRRRSAASRRRRPAAIASAGAWPNTRDRAAVGLRQAEQHVDRRRLAGAVRPEQRDGLAGLDDERHVVDGAHGPARGPERARDVAQLHGGSGAHGVFLAVRGGGPTGSLRDGAHGRDLHDEHRGPRAASPVEPAVTGSA